MTICKKCKKDSMSIIENNANDYLEKCLFCGYEERTYNPVTDTIYCLTGTKHNWILTSRVPDIGGYKQNLKSDKKFADFEFVCPDCGQIRSYTLEVKE
jgi:hypothetical protein